MDRELVDSVRLLESYKFREPATGFYRFNSLEKIADTNKNQSLFNHPINSLFVLEINGYSDLCKLHGDVCGAEIRAHIGAELRKITPANTHICSLDDNMFLLLGDSITDDKIITAILNLREKIELSEITVANDVSVRTNIGVSYLHVYPEKFSELAVCLLFAKMLIELHIDNNKTDTSGLMRLDLNGPLNNYLSRDLSIDKLIESNQITLHFL